MSDDLEQKLRIGLSAIGLSLSDAQVTSLLDFLGLIQKWTKVYNLTAVRDPHEMLTHHLLDSLAVIRSLQAQSTPLLERATEGGAFAVRLTL